MKKIFTFVLFILLSENIFAQLSGTYYIGGPGTKPGGGDPEYTSISAAIYHLNSVGVNGPCIFYFTESKEYIEPNMPSLGCSGTSSTNTITFKPYTAVVCTLIFTSDSAKSIDGSLVIGSPTSNNTNLVPTHYVTIDGSNTNGGTTKDLTIIGPSTSLQRSVIRVYGNNDYITIKNCIIINRSSSANSTAPIQFTNYNTSGTNYTPDNFTIDNNTLISTSGNGGLGLFLSNSGTPTVGMTGVTIANNIISHRGTRGIMCNYVNDANIYGNQISANMQLASGAGAGIWLSTGTSSSGTFNIYNNRFSSLSILNNTAGASNGYIAIDNQLTSPKVVNIYNNFITGFTINSSVSNSKLYGIRHAGSSTSNIYFNTIVIPEMTNMTNFGSSLIAGIAFATAATTEASPSGTINIRNNIIISNESTMKTWGIRRIGTGGTFSSDYNDIYFVTSDSNYAGFWNTTDQKNLSDWQTASGKDLNSVSKAVNFVSSTDLHLTGTSLGDNDLIGTVISGYTTDIDGDIRDSYYPYKGADESLTKKLPSAFFTVTMSDTRSNIEAFGNGSKIGSDGSGIDFYVNWDATYLYLGWSGGNTVYSSDMYYAAIDTDPDGTNGTTDAIEGVGFITGGQKPDYYVVYENNSSFYGVPVSEGNAFEVYNVSGGTWNWVSRTGGDDGTSSQVVFSGTGGEVRLRIPWSTLGGFTPGSGAKLGILMWNNNSSGNYMWARVPNTNPPNGSTPKTLDRYFVYSSTAAGVNPASDANDTPLPVELSSFSASYFNGGVTLNWKTETEVNNYGWEIERSKIDEKTNKPSMWEKIGFVKGSGNSNSPKEYSFIDNKALYGYYAYRLKQIDVDGSILYSSELRIFVGNRPQVYDVKNYPNPFNPQTTIRFELPEAGNVRLAIYDITGQLVKVLVDEWMPEGIHETIFDGSRLASGIYISVLQAKDVKVVKKMQLIK
ncbi:MAG: T9SS type A sorting domain-containing protein [Ignavibacteria bacterium]|jgi:hypothetical protein|nr:T9SS type A sorting domain-containing protein [Ignavibacteria bacterium]MDH7527466.1 T9SS type A sorting domain-containing protein [Ignavibacteria bacterium]